jgi:predicted metal-binding membrane protein
VSRLALRRLGWAHPELGALACAAFAWMTLLLLATGDQGIQSAHQAAHRSEPLLVGLSGWFVMCVAMMMPAASFHARRLALGALWERRQRTIALFLASYLTVWLALGLALLVSLTLLGSSTETGPAPLLALALGLAAAWSLFPWKWRALRRCYLAQPLPPDGSKADRACMAEGRRYGRLCLVADGPLMIATLIAGHEALGLMVLLAIAMTGEKVLARPAFHRHVVAAILVGLAALAFV